MEEPENGIHPARIEAMLDLLRDIATNTEEPLEEGSQLRQVIINTHSPAVVNRLPADTLVFAEREKVLDEQGNLTNKVRFAALPDTWRTQASEPSATITLGKILAYLNPEGETNNTEKSGAIKSEYLRSSKPERRLRDHFAVQLALFTESAEKLW